MTRKIITTAYNKPKADKMVSWVKTLPGVTFATKYKVASKYHILITGEIQDDVCKQILGGKRNLAEGKESIL